MVIIISLCLFLWVVNDIYKEYKIKKKYGSLEAKYKSWFEKEKENIDKQLEEKRVELQNQEKQIDTIIQKEQELIQEKLDKFKKLGYNKINIEIQDFKNKKEQEILEQINNLSSQKQQEINDLFLKSHLEYKEQKEKLRLDLLHQKEENLEYINNLLENKQTLISEIEDYEQKRKAINEAVLREKEIQEKEDFYKIKISESDLDDILILKDIEKKIHNREAINKLIYEVFIKRPSQEMIKRVVQKDKVCGIYKITYIKTGESYIGRSKDIRNRWKQHILSSLNIGSIAHTTFHNFLSEKGLQNFTFEILEEVAPDKLSEREKYWISFYETNKQLNSNIGG